VDHEEVYKLAVERRKNLMELARDDPPRFLTETETVLNKRDLMKERFEERVLAHVEQRVHYPKALLRKVIQLNNGSFWQAVVDGVGTFTTYGIDDTYTRGGLRSLHGIQSGNIIVVTVKVKQVVVGNKQLDQGVGQRRSESRYEDRPSPMSRPYNPDERPFAHRVKFLFTYIAFEDTLEEDMWDMSIYRSRVEEIVAALEEWSHGMLSVEADGPIMLTMPGNRADFDGDGNFRGMWGYSDMAINLAKEVVGFPGEFYDNYHGFYGVVDPKFHPTGGAAAGVTIGFTHQAEDWILSTHTFLHELGHVMGALHSNFKGTEYGDKSCTMGCSSCRGQYNAAYKLDYGWFEPSRVVEHYRLLGEDEQQINVRLGAHDTSSEAYASLPEDIKLVVRAWAHPNYTNTDSTPLVVSVRQDGGVQLHIAPTSTAEDRHTYEEEEDDWRNRVLWTGPTDILDMGDHSENGDVFKGTSGLNDRKEGLAAGSVYFHVQGDYGILVENMGEEMIGGTRVSNISIGFYTMSPFESSLDWARNAGELSSEQSKSILEGACESPETFLDSWNTHITTKDCAHMAKLRDGESCRLSCVAGYRPVSGSQPSFATCTNGNVNMDTTLTCERHTTTETDVSCNHVVVEWDAWHGLQVTMDFIKQEQDVWVTQENIYFYKSDRHWLLDTNTDPSSAISFCRMEDSTNHPSKLRDSDCWSASERFQVRHVFCAGIEFTPDVCPVVIASSTTPAYNPGKVLGAYRWDGVKYKHTEGHTFYKNGNNVEIGGDGIPNVEAHNVGSITHPAVLNYGWWEYIHAPRNEYMKLPGTVQVDCAASCGVFDPTALPENSYSECDPSTRFFAGESCEIKCDEGYIRVGRRKGVECLFDGSWAKPNDLHCVHKDNMVVAGRLQNLNRPGLELRRVRISTCGRDGGWPMLIKGYPYELLLNKRLHRGSEVWQDPYLYEVASSYYQAIEAEATPTLEAARSKFHMNDRCGFVEAQVVPGVEYFVVVFGIGSTVPVGPSPVEIVDFESVQTDSSLPAALKVSGTARDQMNAVYIRADDMNNGHSIYITRRPRTQSYLFRRGTGWAINIENPVFMNGVTSQEVDPRTLADVDPTAAEWDSGIEIEKVKVCGSLPMPRYGKHDCGFAPVVASEQCVFTCDWGFEIVGDDTVSCDSQGNWVNDVPTCRRIECDVFQASNLVAGTIETYVKRYDLDELRPRWQIFSSDSLHVYQVPYRPDDDDEKGKYILSQWGKAWNLGATLESSYGKSSTAVSHPKLVEEWMLYRDSAYAWFDDVEVSCVTEIEYPTLVDVSGSGESTANGIYAPLQDQPYAPYKHTSASVYLYHHNSTSQDENFVGKWCLDDDTIFSNGCAYGSVRSMSWDPTGISGWTNNELRVVDSGCPDQKYFEIPEDKCKSCQVCPEGQVRIGCHGTSMGECVEDDCPFADGSPPCESHECLRDPDSESCKSIVVEYCFTDEGKLDLACQTPVDPECPFDQNDITSPCFHKDCHDVESEECGDVVIEYCSSPGNTDVGCKQAFDGCEYDWDAPGSPCRAKECLRDHESSECEDQINEYCGDEATDDDACEVSFCPFSETVQESPCKHEACKRDSSSTECQNYVDRYCTGNYDDIACLGIKKPETPAPTQAPTPVPECAFHRHRCTCKGTCEWLDGECRKKTFVEVGQGHECSKDGSVSSQYYKPYRVSTLRTCLGLCKYKCHAVSFHQEKRRCELWTVQPDGLRPSSSIHTSCHKKSLISELE